MDWLSTVPPGIWDLPLPMLLIVLLALGVFVTKREHSNMVKMMEYFRTLSENKDATVENQAEALQVVSKELAPLLKEVLIGLRRIAKEKRDDVSTKEE